jgi:hypothetical protein
MERVYEWKKLKQAVISGFSMIFGIANVLLSYHSINLASILLYPPMKSFFIRISNSFLFLILVKRTKCRAMLQFQKTHSLWCFLPLLQRARICTFRSAVDPFSIPFWEIVLGPMTVLEAGELVALDTYIQSSAPWEYANLGYVWNLPHQLRCGGASFGTRSAELRR